MCVCVPMYNLFPVSFHSLPVLLDSFSKNHVYNIQLKPKIFIKSVFRSLCVSDLPTRRVAHVRYARQTIGKFLLIFTDSVCF